jgi:uncharacterized protein YjdB
MLHLSTRLTLQAGFYLEMYNDVPKLETNEAGNDGHHRAGEWGKKQLSEITVAAELVLQLNVIDIAIMKSFTDLRSPSGSKGA